MVIQLAGLDKFTNSCGYWSQPCNLFSQINRTTTYRYIKKLATLQLVQPHQVLNFWFPLHLQNWWILMHILTPIYIDSILLSFRLSMQDSRVLHVALINPNRCIDGQFCSGRGGSLPSLIKIGIVSFLEAWLGFRAPPLLSRRLVLALLQHVLVVLRAGW